MCAAVGSYDKVRLASQAQEKGKLRARGSRDSTKILRLSNLQDYGLRGFRSSCFGHLFEEFDGTHHGRRSKPGAEIQQEVLPKQIPSMCSRKAYRGLSDYPKISVRRDS